ncbi:MAG TPA: tryptophan--tRNA ligase [Acidimicrobiia bacterium]|nr:tryptophan--tRNA ligase [Acidimicrobiia bacterium]
MNDKKRVFSGMQPTGVAQLGNLIGAFSNWVSMQEEYETIYCVVDLHAITAPYDPSDLVESRIRLAKLILASGVDPSRSLLYYQSDLPQHVELSWIIGTLVGVGQLQRMTQFKEKSKKSSQSFGLLAYPVLQAADILIHKAHAVPVGDDQTQHLELTRDLAERFNHRFGEVFPVPERITPEIGARVMSLQDPSSKMSKSDTNSKATVYLTDSTDDIVKKIKAAVTDTGTEVAYDWENKPGISNLLEIFAYFSGRTIDDLLEEYASGGYGQFKMAVAEAVADGVKPIREAYEGMSDDEVLRVMSDSAERASVSADATMKEVKEAVGLA